MSALGWLERVLDTVADHGRELIGLGDPAREDGPSDAELCHRLVEGLGEASNVALAREILQRWSVKDEPQRLVFLNLMAIEFDPDPDAVRRAADAYRPRDPASLRQLLATAEPPRQELIRRLNMAPNGTATLVDMRAFLLEHLADHPQLANVDEDFRHLFGSWFNRGFLRLEQIDWQSPAAVLEKLIRYEAVHPIVGWDELRRRLRGDRRCYAFFHPALPLDPLIFVEVALTRDISSEIGPLIDPHANEGDPRAATTAVFYSINNALVGLRGVSFGNFLIKQVATELKAELPNIETLVTLSPIPRMRAGLREHWEKDPDTIVAVLGDSYQDLITAGRSERPLDAIDTLVREPAGDAQQLLGQCLERLALHYLTGCRRHDRAYDPVEHFHLSNGARLERVNLFANLSDHGLAQSWGCMVNYLYDPATMVENHEAYACDGRIALSKPLERTSRQLLAKHDRKNGDG